MTKYENTELGVHAIVHGRRKGIWLVSVHDSDMPEGQGLVGARGFQLEAEAREYAKECVKP